MEEWGIDNCVCHSLAKKRFKIECGLGAGNGKHLESWSWIDSEDVWIETV